MPHSHGYGLRFENFITEKKSRQLCNSFPDFVKFKLNSFFCRRLSIGCHCTTIVHNLLLKWFWRVTTFLRYLSTLRSFSQLLTKNSTGLATEVRIELTYKRVKAARRSFWLLCYGCGERIRAAVLLLMRQARFFFSTPR